MEQLLLNCYFNKKYSLHCMMHNNTISMQLIDNTTNTIFEGHYDNSKNNISIELVFSLYKAHMTSKLIDITHQQSHVIGNEVYVTRLRLLECKNNPFPELRFVIENNNVYDFININIKFRHKY